MKKSMIFYFTMIIFSLCLICISLSFGEEVMPAPGTVIDKSNIKTYAHLFPPEFIPGFENGFDGLMPPIKITVAQKSRPVLLPAKFRALNEKNKGKYGLDQDGMITGGFDRVGIPFPDAEKGDKDFGTKLMWNYAYKYQCDDSFLPTLSYLQRKGEPVRLYEGVIMNIYFVNRLYIEPKPNYKTPSDLEFATFFLDTAPPSIRNLMTVSHRHMDLTKPDITYIYVPQLRRSLRGEAGQRSAPMAGSITSLDDAAGFSGRPYEYTYRLLGEQKVLQSWDSKLTYAAAKKMGLGEIPRAFDNWEIRDVWVVEVTPKDPKYPQSKKHLYIDKNTLASIYQLAWDRAGKHWKTWVLVSVRAKMPDGEEYMTMSGEIAMDVQFGISAGLVFDYGPHLMNTGKLTYEDFMQSNLSKKAQ